MAFSKIIIVGAALGFSFSIKILVYFFENTKKNGSIWNLKWFPKLIPENKYTNWFPDILDGTHHGLISDIQYFQIEIYIKLWSTIKQQNHKSIRLKVKKYIYHIYPYKNINGQIQKK